MIELNSGEDFWDLIHKFDALLVTTNGIVKKDGTLVMGAGIARQFADRYPTVPRTLGDWVTKLGNEPCCIHGKNRAIISMPTKEHWKLDSKYDLIESSAHAVNDIISKWGFKRVLSTRPGCGMGKLQWSDVKNILGDIWDDKYTVLGPKD